MARKVMWSYFFIFVFLFCFLGCTSVSKAIDNYKACQGDSVCLSKMNEVKEASYVVTKTASSNLPLPSVPEVLAVVVSNIVSFCYGVFHGKKKG